MGLKVFRGDSSSLRIRAVDAPVDQLQGWFEPAVPDGDLFKTLASGQASIVTDQIDTFTEKGILVKSGRETGGGHHHHGHRSEPSNARRDGTNRRRRADSGCPATQGVCAGLTKGQFNFR
jgi:hypothetical protein